MSETPIKGLKKFQTISIIDKSYKTGLSTTVNRLTERRKSNSLIANPQSILNTTLPHIEDVTLPKIQQKKKAKKHGTFLQSWLDEALGSPDPLISQRPRQQQKVQSSILKSLKKYELDKRHLQSQNIPGQKVQKLYQSLYIYSHGVNNIFQQLIKISKDASYPDLVGNFWRAYTKLLQSCTSYQTVFQRVEKDHLLNIKHLRSNIEKRTETFQEQKKEYEEKIAKLQKTIEQKDMKFTQLKGQHEVTQNTLQLTDDAFNQEVNIRLKFEQKINAVYTCYQQLKAKYSKLVEDMIVKNSDIINGQNKQNILKNQLSIEKIKVEELMFLLNAEKERVKERQAEILIKNQQLQDANAMVLARCNQQDKTQDKMQEYLSKLKALKSKLTEVQNVVSGQKLCIKELQEQINKLSKSLSYYKEQNNQIYIKYSNSGKKIVQLQSQIQENNIKICDLQKNKVQKGSQISDLTRQLQHVRNQRDNLRNQLTTAQRNLKDTKDTMSKNNALLQQLKAIKDKYERINEYLTIDIQQLQSAHNKSMQDLRTKTQQIQGMRLLLDNRNKALIQAQKTIEQERQLAKMKLQALNASIGKKQTLTLQYQKKCQQLQKNVINCRSETKLILEKCTILQSVKIKLQIELDRKGRLLADLQNVLVKQNNKFKQLAQKLQGQLKQKSSIYSKLNTTQFVLKTKNQQQRVQVQSLSMLLSEYKGRLIERSQYIHPMVYEQVLEVARRCQYKEQKARKQQQKYKKITETLKQKIKSLQNELEQTKTKMEELQKKNNKSSQQKAIQRQQKIKVQQRCKRFENNLSEMTKRYQNQKQKYDKLVIQLEQLKILDKNNKQKIDLLQSDIFHTKSKLQKISTQKKKTSRGQTNRAQTNRAQTSRAQTREAKRQKKQTKEVKVTKETKQQQVQTETFQQEIINMLEKNQQEEQEKIEKQDKQVQTEVVEKISFNSMQIFQPYKNHQVNKQQGQNGTGRRQRQRQDSTQRKIENKEFKRALKLTYMRR